MFRIKPDRRWSVVFDHVLVAGELATINCAAYLPERKYRRWATETSNLFAAARDGFHREIRNDTRVLLGYALGYAFL